MVWKAFLFLLIVCCNGVILEETSFKKIMTLSRNRRATPKIGPPYTNALIRNGTVAKSEEGGGSGKPGDAGAGALSGDIGGSTPSGGRPPASLTKIDLTSETSGGIAESGVPGGGAPSGVAEGSTSSGGRPPARRTKINLTSETSGGGTTESGIPGSGAPSGVAKGSISSGGRPPASPTKGNLTTETSGRRTAESDVPGGVAPSRILEGNTPSGRRPLESPTIGHLTSEISDRGAVETEVRRGGVASGSTVGNTPSRRLPPASPNPRNFTSKPASGEGSASTKAHDPYMVYSLPPATGGRHSKDHRRREQTDSVRKEQLPGPSGHTGSTTTSEGLPPASPNTGNVISKPPSEEGPASARSHYYYLIHFLERATGDPRLKNARRREQANSDRKKQQPGRSGSAGGGPARLDLPAVALGGDGPANVSMHDYYTVNSLQLVTGGLEKKPRRTEQAKDNRSQREPTPPGRKDPPLAGHTPPDLHSSASSGGRSADASEHYHYLVHFLELVTGRPNAKRPDLDKKDQQIMQATKIGRLARVAAGWKVTLPPTKKCGDLPSPKVTMVDPTARTWVFTHPPGTWVCTGCNIPDNNPMSTVTKYLPFFTPFTAFTGEATPLPPPTRGPDDY